MSTTYLLKTGIKRPGGRSDPRRLIQADALRVQFRRRTALTGRKIGGGLFAEAVDGGPDRSCYWVSAPYSGDEPPARDARGRKATGVRYVEVPATRVKDRVRVLREADRAALEENDRQIEEAQAVVARRRAEREKIIERAFLRGKLLYAGDLTEMVPE